MRYQHDCSKCQPLGEFGNADLYFCPQHGYPTVIARYGSEGGNYKSGLQFADYDSAIGEAKKRAQIDGLLP